MKISIRLDLAKLGAWEIILTEINNRWSKEQGGGPAGHRYPGNKSCKIGHRVVLRGEKTKPNSTRSVQYNNRFSLSENEMNKM